MQLIRCCNKCIKYLFFFRPTPEPEPVAPQSPEEQKIVAEEPQEAEAVKEAEAPIQSGNEVVNSWEWKYSYRCKIVVHLWGRFWL